MIQVKLKGGKEITIDLYALETADVRALLNKETSEYDSDVILSKAVGLSVDELAKLPFPDYRKITKKFWEYIRYPLNDEDDVKNSQSASTSE